ncbi:MAG: TonB-dependent receptor [Bacteroidia bacterium]|nr:TonB-dependent receptor [Bacteroidia bacterium]
MSRVLILFFGLYGIIATAQQMSGSVTSNGFPLPYANILIEGTTKGASTDDNGRYVISDLESGTYTAVVTFSGLKTIKQSVSILGKDIVVDFRLDEADMLDEVVVSGTLKAISRLESPVPVEVYSPTFLKKNPTANIFEALQNVNGVRPQINCQVCNTGDIHINGLEGPYTMVLIDGMPIVSGLSTVYGLSGIPNSLIEQVEIVKGPASSLYGSEAVGGLINIITKIPENAPRAFVDTFGSGWGEINADVGFKTTVGSNTNLLFGINYFNYSNPIDNNNDNFTDLTLQDRLSIFQKWDFKRKENRKFSLVGRFFYEDRWGGEMQWSPEFRGGDQIYGESIYTRRFEVLGHYQLPVSEKMMLQFSFTDHDQNSVYGNMPYLAKQRIGFGQFSWDKTLGKHNLLLGAAARYNYYNDNTPATVNSEEVVIPSIFIQDEFSLGGRHEMLLGARYDYDKRHGNIFTPRLAYKFKPSDQDVIRLNAGTGFRVVNLFTEDHAAVTGSREVLIEEQLKPERSINVNLNYLRKFFTEKGMIISLEASAWYTYFSNVILPDYDTNPNQIIYANLDGKAQSRGVSLNIDATIASGIKFMAGVTLQDVDQTQDGESRQQILTESFMGTWGASYKNYATNLTIDYTGNIYGPMRLPLLGALDPRSEYSPTWSIQNIQATYDGFKNIEIYGGIKNLLNWTPNRGNPFIIARADDPFDENVQFDSNGDVIPTADNPYALTFDPSYVYGPNQGRRLFLGVRYTLN